MKLTKKYMKMEAKEHSKPKMSAKHKMHEKKETPAHKKEEKKMMKSPLYKKLMTKAKK